MDSGIGTKDKITCALFCVLNLFAIVALAVLAALGGSGTAGTVFGALCLAVLCADVIYAAIQKRLVLTRIIVSVLAAVEISYAGHSCDYFMSGRSNRLITYCAERFMAALSV